MAMKLKKLKSILQSLEVFETPKISLEQYATAADCAADMLHVASFEFDDIEGKFVADLGCGCGILGIGAALLNAGYCIGFDIDEDALEVAECNREEVDCENIDFVQCDALSLENSRWHKKFDTVIMNPPFGTKNNKGRDMLFLRTALSIAKTAVYSLHKSTTIEHIEKVAKSWGVKMECRYEIKFELPEVYKKHILASKDVHVHLIRFSFK